MQAVISTPNNGNNGNGKAMVLSFAENNGHIKYMGYSDGWLHKDCGGTLSAKKMRRKGLPCLLASPKDDGITAIFSSFGKPGYFDCRKCGDSFKKQTMLATQMDTRMARAEALLPTVSLEHRNDKIGLIRFVVSSQSRPKAYLVYRDNHGNWQCGCEDFQKHRKFDDWHCKHVLASELWLENEKQSKKDVPIRPSLIVTGTQDEFEKANSLDEKQIVQGNDGKSEGKAYTFLLAYLINGKVAISYCGTMTLAKMMAIKVELVETRDTSEMIVAVAKASNPFTKITQCGAHSQAKRFDAGRLDSDAEVKATEKAKRNAILKVIPEYQTYLWAEKHAQEPSFDYLDAYYACQKVYIDKGLGDFHVNSVVKELYPNIPSADIDRDGWIAIYKACQKHADELDRNPEVEKSKSYWAKTTDGDTVLVTENGEKSPSPTCEY